MSSVYDGDASRLAPKARNTRSHSLKPPSQPVIFKRSKRTMSLPSKPVLLPLINVQRHYDNWGDDGQENEDGQRSKEEMGKLCFDCFCFHTENTYSVMWPLILNRPNRLNQCCTQFKSPGIKILCVAFALECGIHIYMISKFMKQNVLFPKGLNWVQHWVSRLGLLSFRGPESSSLACSLTILGFHVTSRRPCSWTEQ